MSHAPDKADDQKMESDDDREQDLEDRVFPSFQVLMSLVLLLSK